MVGNEKEQIYYGWKIVAALLFLLTFTSGLSFYNHAIYLNALATQSNFDVSTASTAVSIFFLTGGVMGLFVARWVQEYDCLLYTSPSPRDQRGSRMPSSA